MEIVCLIGCRFWRPNLFEPLDDTSNEVLLDDARKSRGRHGSHNRDSTCDIKQSSRQALFRASRYYLLLLEQIRGVVVFELTRETTIIGTAHVRERRLVTYDRRLLILCRISPIGGH